MRDMARFLAAGALFAAMAFPASAQQDDDSGIIEMTEVTCRDLLLFDGDEEEKVLIFFHGYMSGLSKNTTVDVPTFGEASVSITETCIDAPDMKLMDAFAAHR